mmetsp:Transcript_5601/g.13537  ORF Transcript_5601/g.13537 Transcript_5601/m.13537 type:complete len:433 (+) Transcript_5601:292-1590(+)
MTIPRPPSMMVMNEEEDNGQLQQGGRGEESTTTKEMTVTTKIQEEKMAMAYNGGGSGHGGSSSSDQQSLNLITHSESELSSSSEFNDNAVNVSGNRIEADNNDNDEDDDEELRSSDRDMNQHDANDQSGGEDTTTTKPTSAAAATTTAVSPSPVPISSTSTAAATTTNSKKKKNRGVRFGNITIHELPMIVGDNPAVSVGPPVTIGWMPPVSSSSYSNYGQSDDDKSNAAESAIVVSLDNYEKQRPVPRNRSQLRMPSSYRTELLRRQGFSRREIMEGSKQAAILRYRRKRTIELMHFTPAIEVVERVRRGILNVTVKRSAKVAERQMLSKFVVSDVDGIDGVPPPAIPGSISEARPSATTTTSTASTNIKTTKRNIRNSICLKSKDSIEMLKSRSTPFTEAASGFCLSDIHEVEDDDEAAVVAAAAAAVPM